MDITEGSQVSAQVPAPKQPSTSAASSAQKEKENPRRSTPMDVGDVTAGPSSLLTGTDFCWVCHLPRPVFKCSTCPRMYHGRCPFKMPGYPVGTYKRVEQVEGNLETIMVECPECLIAKNTNQTNLKGQPELVKEICLHVLNVLKDDVLKEKPNPFISLKEKKDHKYVKLVKKVMDLEILEAIVRRREILTLEGFLGELKWLVHNTTITEGIRLDPDYIIPKLKAVNDMIYQCKLEMCEASACPRWYMLITDKTLKESVKFKEFIKPCNPPHLLVWVKVANFPWWPAKIRYALGEGSFSVAFFRDFKPSTVKACDIRLLSEDPPSAYRGSGKIKPKLNEALRDLGKHLEKLTEMFGKVKLAAKNTPMPEVNKIDKSVLVTMFPNYNGY